MCLPTILIVAPDELIQPISPFNDGANAGRTFNDVQGKYIGAVIEG